MEPNNIILVVCVVIFTAMAAVWDWRTKRLPNVLTVSALVCALVFHLVYGFADDGLAGAGRQLLISLGGFGTGFGILMILWLIGSGGGGDVKFMGALGAWLGAWPTIQVFVVSAVLVLIGSTVVLTVQFCNKGFMRTRSQYIERGHDKKRPMSDEAQQRQRTKRRLMPFGVPAAVATWLVLAFSILNQQ